MQEWESKKPFCHLVVSSVSAEDQNWAACLSLCMHGCKCHDCSCLVVGEVWIYGWRCEFLRVFCAYLELSLVRILLVLVYEDYVSGDRRCMDARWLDREWSLWVVVVRFLGTSYTDAHAAPTLDLGHSSTNCTYTIYVDCVCWRILLVVRS